ncbi:Dcp1p-Dcp2p decapping enzyme complex alpha subunit [Saitoella coloradoensis]
MAVAVPEIGTKDLDWRPIRDRDELHRLRDRVGQILGIPEDRGRRQRFPGAQPVSFSKHHIDELKREDYYVCEKSDGLRLLMYITQERGREAVYMIDRKNEYYQLPPNMHVPCAGDRTLEQAVHRDTLLDGEVVYDFEKRVGGDGVETKVKRLNYLVFDCMVMDGKRLVERTYDKRIAYFRENIGVPYEQFRVKMRTEKRKPPPLFIKEKGFEFAYGMVHMFRNVLPNLTHGNDGLIFTNRIAPYEFGTSDKILKWKPAHENTIDFRLDIEPAKTSDGHEDFNLIPSLHLYQWEGGPSYAYFAPLHVDTSDWDRMMRERGDNPMPGLIVECRLDKGGRWRFNRFRPDKEDGNHRSVVEKVLRSIEDGVTEKELQSHDWEIKKAWKERNAGVLVAGGNGNENEHREERMANGDRAASIVSGSGSEVKDVESRKRKHSAEEEEEEDGGVKVAKIESAQPEEVQHETTE